MQTFCSKDDVLLQSLCVFTFVLIIVSFDVFLNQVLEGAMNDNNGLIVYCAVGGALLLVGILTTVLWVRHRRKNGAPICCCCAQEEITFGEDRAIGRTRYEALGGDESRGRKPSNVTNDSHMTNQTQSSATGGDLADYLQNLVDGMEKGRQMQAQHHNPILTVPKKASRQAVTSHAAIGQPLYNGRNTAAESSLFTIPSNTSHVARGVPSHTATLLTHSRGEIPDGLALSLGPSIAFQQQQLGDNEEISAEKISGIERWRDDVLRASANVASLDDPSQPAVVAGGEECYGYEFSGELPTSRSAGEHIDALGET